MADVVKVEGTQDEVKEINDGKNPLEIPKEEKPALNIYEPVEEEEGDKKDEEEKPAEKPAGAVKTGEKEGEDKSKEKEEVVKKVEKVPDELSELRQIAREQKRQISKMNEDLEKAQKALQKAELLPTDDADVVKKAQELQELRAHSLETILEIMELNPKYEDVSEVVTQVRFDDIVEAMAQYVQKEEGGKLIDQVKKVEVGIWAMANPYKFMYNKIKQYHPDYVKAKDDAVKTKEKNDEKKDVGTKEGKEANPPKIPGSILDLQGGGSGDAGWTSAMIDALEETELSKVPPKIYEHYLKNELA